uniref:Interleukin-12 subunit alpha n=1 Tax=Oryzias sinensis TaxID=183150 RepID=A0A8C8E2W5_9TELE
MNFRALVLLFGFLDTALCAPYGVQDACGDVRISSLGLNHLAKSALLEARNGSTDQASFSGLFAFVEAEDMCDPQSLTQKPMPCVGKIFKTLISYSSAVKRISGFQSCMKSARKVGLALEKLQTDMRKCVESLTSLSHLHLNSVSIEEDTWPTEHWKEPLLCSYTLDRLFSFSILTARVFAAGDPAQHTASSAKKCM